MRYAAKIQFQCTNNTAEYEAIILALSKLRALSVRRALIKTDSQVISGHIEKSFNAKEPELQKYLQHVRKLETFFFGITTKSIPRSENSEADKLAKAAAQSLTLPPDVFFETLCHPATHQQAKPAKLINSIASEDWRSQIVAYLKGHFEPENREQQNKISQ